MFDYSYCVYVENEVWSKHIASLQICNNLHVPRITQEPKCVNLKSIFRFKKCSRSVISERPFIIQTWRIRCIISVSNLNMLWVHIYFQTGKKNTVHENKKNCNFLTHPIAVLK